MNNDIVRRVEALRAWMRSRGFDAFVVPSTDPHGSEYVAPYWMCRQWLTGFTGSAGTAIVTLNDAALWTDSRYWLAAEEQLAGTPFTLMRQGHSDALPPAVWLKMQGCTRVACDPWVNDSACRPNDPEQIAMTWEHGAASTAPFAEIWTDRPPMPQGKVVTQPIEWAGETTAQKLARVRTCLHDRSADAALFTALDDIAWLLNLRGDDVHCTPVFVAYMIVRPTSATVYTYHDLPPVEGVTVAPYEAIAADLAALKGRLMLDSDSVNLALSSLITCQKLEGIPVPHFKVVKNEAEQRGFHSAMLKDGVAMVQFLRRLDDMMANPSGEPITEMGVDQLLTGLRAKQEGFLDLSFDTIAGYGHHGAIVHYEATPDTDIPLQPRGLLLLDSGGQYVEGTTDITRTIALGPLTDEERRDYTLVLMGHIDLARAVFPSGSKGTQLDALARQHLWRAASDYGHGTGHGVGSRLSVHEGPHQFRKNWMPEPLRPGMTITVEPGIYRDGSHGVRIENTMLIVPLGQSPLTDAQPGPKPDVNVPPSFLKRVPGPTVLPAFSELEPLTLCPIDVRPIVPEMLEPHHIDYLNRYHALVLQRLSPLLDGDDLAWLQRACAPI